MATLTYNQKSRQREVQRIRIYIKDYANKARYDTTQRKAFFPWQLVSELKHYLLEKSGLPKDKQRIFHKQNELTYKFTTIEDLLENEDQKELYLNLYSSDQVDNKKEGDSLIFVNEELEDKAKTKFKKIVHAIKIGFQKGFIPKALEEGVSGNYFLRDDTKKNVAIFKPFDEEAFAPNNPKGYTGILGYDKGFRDGVLSGEAATREVAAY